jgi:hypothetical protein
LQQHKKYLDFELHGFFHYPFIQRLRRDFLILMKLGSMFANRSSVESFASLAACVCEDKDRGLRFSAQLALQVQEYRRNWFRRLSSEAMKHELATRARRQSSLFSNLFGFTLEASPPLQRWKMETCSNI